MSEPIHDLAHIGHAELLTPVPDESPRFFVDLFGMEIEAAEGEPVSYGAPDVSGTATGPPIPPTSRVPVL